MPEPRGRGAAHPGQGRAGGKSGWPDVIMLEGGGITAGSKEAKRIRRARSAGVSGVYNDEWDERGLKRKIRPGPRPLPLA